MVNGWNNTFQPLPDLLNIIKLIKSGQPTEHIKKRREYSRMILRHSKKEGLDEFLSQINGYENTEQHKLRKKFAISNKFVTSELLRPVDNVWNARGGSFEITMSEKIRRTYIEDISSAWHGASIHEFIKEIWLEAYIEDPNGLIYLVLDEKTKQYQPQYESIFKILDYELKGKKPLYILFEPIETLSEDGKKVYTYTYIDSDKICKYQKVDDVVTELTDQQQKNVLGRVPAIVVSNIVTKDNDIRLSPLDVQIELLDAYVRKNSVKEIFEFLHGYPKFWYYGEICTECNGAGRVERGAPDPGWDKCPKCGGHGRAGEKLDVSDGMLLQVPKDDEQKLADKPLGFESPPVEIWQEMRSELDWMFDLVFRSHWGTTIEKGKNETATGRFIDVQPVQNKLSKYTDAAETVENELYEIIGKLSYPNTFKRSFRQYGRRYIIESPDASLKRYQDGLTAFLPTSLLDYLLEQYYSSEFASDEASYNRRIKLSKVEPFIHYSVGDVSGWPIAENLKLQKAMFNEWLSVQNPEDLNTKSVEELKKSLEEFTTTKNPNTDGRNPGFKQPDVPTT